MTHNTQENKKWPQYVTVLIALICVFSAGISVGWPSPFLPILLSEDFALNITSEDASYITIISSVGEIIGTIISSVLMDLIGRKSTLLLTAPCNMMSMVLIFFSSTSVGLLYAGRTIGGIAVGSSIIVAPVYICEISEARIRGTSSSLFTVFFFCGLLFINLVGSCNSIEATSLIIAAFPVLFFFLFVLMPESPYYLLMKKQSDEAAKSLKKLRWNENVGEELSILQNDVKRQMSETSRLQDLVLIESNRRATIILCVLTFFQTFSGILPLTTYAQIFFAAATDVIPESSAAVLIIVIEVIFLFVAAAFADILGRRVLLLISTAGCFTALTSLSVFFFLKDFTDLQVESFSWLAILGMILFSIFYVVGLGLVVNCMIGELFSVSVKAKGVCVATILYSAGVFSSIKLYQVLGDRYSTGVPLLLFGVIQFVGFGYCWRYVPETKGKSLEEIQQEIKS